MPRFKQINNEKIQFTAEEEAARDNEETQFAIEKQAEIDAATAKATKKASGKQKLLPTFWGPATLGPTIWGPTAWESTLGQPDLGLSMRSLKWSLQSGGLQS